MMALTTVRPWGPLSVHASVRARASASAAASSWVLMTASRSARPSAARSAAPSAAMSARRSAARSARRSSARAPRRPAGRTTHGGPAAPSLAVRVSPAHRPYYWAAHYCHRWQRDDCEQSAPHRIPRAVSNGAVATRRQEPGGWALGVQRFIAMVPSGFSTLRAKRRSADRRCPLFRRVRRGGSTQAEVRDSERRGPRRNSAYYET